MDVKEDTQRIFYYDDEDDYDDDEYDYEEDYDKDASKDPTISNYLQFPLVTPRKTTKTTTITTTTTTTTTSTTTEKATEATRRSTAGRKSYSPGGYKRYDSSKDFEKQRPRSFESDVTTKAPTKAKDIACNSPQMLKKFLKSGAHGNDPRKIKAMIEKCQKDKQNDALNSDKVASKKPEEDNNAMSIFEKYASKKSNNDKEVGTAPKSFLPPGYNGFESSKKTFKDKDSNRKIGSSYGKATESSEDEEYDDDDEYYDDDYEDENNNDDFKPYGGVVRPKGTSSSSNLFRKFIKHNAGKTVRRPTNINDEEGKVASDIFKKYSSGFSINRPKGGYNKVSFDLVIAVIR